MVFYKDWIEGEGLEQICEWAKSGFTDKQIIEKMGIKERTFYSWQKKFPDFQKALKEAMEAVYRISPSENLQKSLISYGSEIALEQYVSNLSETHVLPEGDVMFADGPTSAICSVKDPSLLPLLGQLLEIVFIPEFKDAVFFTLREGLIEAFLHCSNADPDASLAEIEKHSGGAAASAKNTSIYETIREDAKKQQLRKANQAWTIESVEKYWRELEHKAQQT